MMTKEIQDAIEKGLPAQTAGALKARLDMVDSLEETANRLQKECLKLKEENKSLESQIKDQNASEALKTLLQQKELSLEKRERELDKAILTTQLEAEKASTQKIYNLVDMVFRNKTTVRYETTSVPVFTPYMGGGGNHEMKNGFNTSEEKTEIR